MKTLDTEAAIHPKDRKILSELARIVRSLLPGATIYLFGSAVRGLRETGSDLDVLIISNARLSLQEEAAVADAVYDLELANGVGISTLFYSREEWEAPPGPRYAVPRTHRGRGGSPMTPERGRMLVQAEHGTA